MELKKSEANEAMNEELPVMYKGQRFKRINAIIARRFNAGDYRTIGMATHGKSNTIIYLELYEDKTNSVTIAPLEDVEVIDEDVV